MENKQITTNSKELNLRINELIRKRNASVESNRHIYSNLSIDELIEQTDAVSLEKLDKFFKQNHSYNTSEQVIEKVESSLMSITQTLNDFPKEKRFYILQTINFFEQSDQIDRLLPALLVYTGIQQKQELLDFVFSTFLTLKKNIETIISTPELFSQSSLHIERGGLYSLISDIAKQILKLFQKSYLEKFEDLTSEVAILSRIIQTYRQAKEVVNDHTLLQENNLKTDEEDFYRLVLDIIASIQTHDLLVLYAKKRDNYYKRHVKKLLHKSHVKAFNPVQSRKIIASCLLLNPQLKPQKELLDRLFSDHQEISEDDLQEISLLINDLAPSTIYNLINDYKFSAGNLLRSKQNKTAKKNGKPSFKDKFMAKLKPGKAKT